MISQPEKPMTLRTLFDQYQQTQAKMTRQTRARYAAALRWLIMSMRGREPRLYDLTAATLHELIRYCLRQGLSRKAVETHRNCLVRLWKFAAERRLVDTTPVVPAVTGRHYLRLPVNKSLPPVDSLRHFFSNEFFPHQLAGRNPTTVKQHESAVGHYTVFADDDVMLASVTKEKLAKYHRWLIDVAGKSLVYAERMMTCMRCIMRHAEPALFPKRPPAHAVTDPQSAAGTFRHFFETRFLAERDIMSGTVLHYRICVRSFLQHVGEIQVTEINADLVNHWLMALESTGLKKPTLKNYAGAIATIWRSAWHRKLTDEQCRGIRRIKLRLPNPDAWTLEELGRLVLAAGDPQFDKSFRQNRVHIGRYFKAFILANHDTMLRRSDMFRLRREMIADDGSFVIEMQKTGDPIKCQLRPETLDAIDATFPPQREFIFPMAGRANTTHHQWFRKLLAVAGLPVDKRNQAQKLRRTGASHLEAFERGSATMALGHRSVDLARRHYIDIRIGRPRAALPPAPVMPKLLPAPREKDGAA